MILRGPLVCLNAIKGMNLDTSGEGQDTEDLLGQTTDNWFDPSDFVG